MPTRLWFLSRLLVVLITTGLAMGLVLTVPSQGQPAREVQPEAASLQSCVGRYEASEDTIITVRSQGDQLTLEVNSGAPIVFSLESKDQYVNEQSGTRIGFFRDEQGKVTELVLHRGGEHHAKRIAEVPASEEGRTVEVNGTTFRTLISGDGKEPVVLVSGLENWAKVASGLQREARVVRYKAEGVGISNGVPLDVRTQVRFLHELLKTLAITQPYTLAGHSYEGALIRIYADVYPAEVAGLVLVDPFDEGFVDWLKANQPENYELFRQRATHNYVANWDDFLDRLRRARIPKGIPVVLLTGGHRQIRENDALETKIKTADFEAGAAAVMKAHQSFIAKVPNGWQVVVPNAGHEIPREQPDFVIQAIQQELKDMRERPK